MAGARLLIVADDFTGGLDTGVQFARRGIGVRVVVNPGAAEDWAAVKEQVLVAVTESRRMSPGNAYAAVYAIVSAGRRAGIPNIYKKTDSALRGNIGAELNAALDASGARVLPFLPAYPAMGRVTAGGRHYIDGAPVSESVFARDPFNPVLESDVRRLISAQTRTPVWISKPEQPAPANGILVVDAQSDEDLRQAGERLAEAGALRVSAGCAGFAAFLPRLLGLTEGAPPKLPPLGDGLLVVCGSVNPITRGQLDWASARGFARVPPTFGGDCPRDRWLIVDANVPGTGAAMPEVSRASEAERLGVLDRLAEALAALEPSRSGLVLMTGGDTLTHCLARLDCRQLEPLLELFPGVVLSRIRVRDRERLIVSKSGGFGRETLLADLKALIEGQRQDRR